jgi:hypothetical protein
VYNAEGMSERDPLLQRATGEALRLIVAPFRRIGNTAFRGQARNSVEKLESELDSAESALVNTIRTLYSGEHPAVTEIDTREPAFMTVTTATPISETSIPNSPLGYSNHTVQCEVPVPLGHHNSPDWEKAKISVVKKNLMSKEKGKFRIRASITEYPLLDSWTKDPTVLVSAATKLQSLNEEISHLADTPTPR